MDGITFLRKIMAQRPIPTSCARRCSKRARTRCSTALEAGAVDVILKPRVDTKQFLDESQVRICDAVRAAARARVRGARGGAPRRSRRS